eukprot:gene130-3521_t
MSWFLSSCNKEQYNKHTGSNVRQTTLRDTKYQHLHSVAKEKGEQKLTALSLAAQKASTEYAIDWGDIRKRASPQKEGYLQMLAADGSWQDIRVLLYASHLSILKPSPNPTKTDTLSIPTNHNQVEMPREITIYKTPGEPLGLSIKGGQEYRLPIFVSQLREGSAAEASKACFVGDEILKVNGVSLHHASQSDAIDIIQDTYSCSEVHLELRFYLAARHQLVADYLRTPEPALQSAPSFQWMQVTTIPLQYCHVSHFHDTSAQPREQMSFIVRSAHDVHSSAILRPVFGQAHLMREWIRAIRKARDDFPCVTLCKPNPPMEFTGRVVHIGRVHERLSDGVWRDMFLVLTDHDCAFHLSPPISADDLTRPYYGPYPLLACQFSMTSRKASLLDVGLFGLLAFKPPLDAREREESCFLIKTSSGMTAYLSAGSTKMAHRWQNMFEQRTDTVVQKLGAITYSVGGDQYLALTVNWQTGLWLNNDTRNNKSLVWHHPFVNLRAARITGSNSLHFRFAESSQDIVVEEPAMIKSVIIAFMSCHVRTRERHRVLSVA